MRNRVCFGPFALDFDTRELLREGEPVPLSPKAFQLLELLVSSRPKAQSRTTLQEHLWPNTFVVEKNLTNLVSEIREALGDAAHGPRYLRTVRGFGYAFCEVPAHLDPNGAADAGIRSRYSLVWDGGRIPLSDGEHVLGRDPDAALCFDFPSISRRHALITIAGRNATLEDLGSKNGTFIGRRRVNSREALADGDVIQVGSVALTFVAVGAQPTLTSSS